MATKQLKIDNINNKLQCPAFLDINFAPARGTIRESDFETTFVVVGPSGESILVRVADFTRIRFGNIVSIVTYPATGLDSCTWKRQWLTRFPSTTDDTELAVYCYRRVE